MRPIQTLLVKSFDAVHIETFVFYLIAELMKRILDLVVATFGLIVCAPLLLVLIILVRVKLGSPVFFCQARPGINGRPFTMLKFRTMLNARDANGNMLPDERRLTSFGRLLRATSLDELPELWNVLRGDMSLVGPRPLLMEYLPLYSQHQARRHEVRPGVTGWAQVNGRNALSWDEKFELDVWYVDHRSLQLDALILWLTVKKVLVREGINTDDDAIMPVFRGNNEQR